MLGFVNINNDLNEEQNIAYKLMLAGKSLFITGPGGSGKSYLLNKFYKRAVEIHGSSKIVKTSTTGISALNIEGRTIHSWAGIGLGNESVDVLLRDMFPTSKERWRRIKTIIIDEISMLHPDIIDKLYIIGKTLNEKPIQYIFLGDGFQLPVVKSERQFFEAKYWDQIVGNRTIRLSKVVRQSDKTFKQLLNQIRVGICTKKTEDILNSRVGAELTNQHGILPTILYPKNVSVSDKNKKELDKLKRLGNKCALYKAEYSCVYNNSKKTTQTLIAEFKKNSNLEDEIELAIGAQVLFKKNIKELGVVNGTRAVIINFVDKLPIVRLLNGEEIEVKHEEFKYCIKEEFEIKKKQIPLKLAWACSIHSSQGLTLDYLIADVGDNIFDYGQSYVVLSRVKTIEGLSLMSFNKEKIIVNPKVLDKYYPEINVLNKCSLPDSIIDSIMSYIV